MNACDYFLEKSGNLEKDFVLGNAGKISYPELSLQSRKLASYLFKTINENNNIVVLFPNSVTFILIYLAVLKSGNVCVPLNTDIEKKNLDYIVDKTNAKVFFVQKKNRHTIDYPDVILIDEEDLARIIENNNPVDFSADFDESRLAEIIFTSGSTGEPKGVMITHRNLITNTNSILEYLKLNTNDIILIVLPFYYCYGLSLLHTHLRVGGSIVLNNTFIFLGSVINDLINYNCTGFSGVPSHFQILLRKTKSFKDTSFPSLRYVTQAGGKLHTVFIKEFIDTFPNTTFYVMYGQTEATARLSFLPPERLKDKLGSIGNGIPGVKLDIFNERNEPTAPDEVGELVASGENIMKGYLGDEEATGQVIRNGWLHTGDLAKRDEDGFFYLVGRSKEMIKVGGRRINPKEIEEVILRLPEVIDCSIDGVEDELLGEAIKATIYINNIKDNKLIAKDIQTYCAERLVSFKIPQFIEFKENINIASTGKKVKGKL
jgi:long-chain acyl-CoA synthetase